jgi:AraC-like DNA-binding protein
MVGVIRRSFSDPHAYEQTLRGALASQYTTSARGVFEAELTIIDLDRVWLQRGSENLPRTMHIDVESKRRTVAFLVDGNAARLLLSGYDFDAQHIVSLGYGSSHFQRTFGPVHWAAMSLPEGCLEEAARTMADGDIGEPRTTLWAKKPSAEHLTQLRRLHQSVDQMARSGDAPLDHPEVRRALEQSITVAMVACLTAGTDKGRTSGWQRHQQRMRLFKEWLDANAGRAVYLQEICSALNISAPTLRRSCEEHLGMSPMQYLWLRRMNLARRELQRADSSASVTATAMNFGFWHLGRFADEYRSLFGETPSATKARRSRG